MRACAQKEAAPRGAVRASHVGDGNDTPPGHQRVVHLRPSGLVIWHEACELRTCVQFLVWSCHWAILSMQKIVLIGNFLPVSLGHAMRACVQKEAAACGAMRAPRVRDRNDTPAGHIRVVYHRPSGLVAGRESCMLRTEVQFRVRSFLWAILCVQKILHGDQNPWKLTPRYQVRSSAS